MMQYLKYRITKQIVINVLMISQGMILEMSGVSLVDLRWQVGYNHEQMARALAVQSSGLLCGAVSGGFMHQIFHRHTELITVSGVLLMGLAQATIPWLRSGDLLTVAMYVIGVGQGLLNTGGNPLVMTLWGERAAPPLHSLHFSSSLGAVIATQLTRPFLRPRDGGGGQNHTTTDLSVPGLNDTTYDLGTHHWPSPASWNTTRSSLASNLLVPYTVTAACTFFFGLLLIVFYAKGPPEGFPQRKPNVQLKQLLSPGSCTNGRVIYGALLLTSLHLFYTQAVGLERIFGKYLFTFALGTHPGCSQDEAALLVTAFYLALLCGRFLGIFVSHVIPTPWMMLADIVGILGTAVLGAVFVNESMSALWAVTILVGAFCSILFPSGMAWANMYMEPNSMVVMLMMLGSASGSLAYQYVTGSLFHRYGFYCFPYVGVACASALFLVFIAMTTIARTCGRPAGRVIISEVIGCEERALKTCSKAEGGDSGDISPHEDGSEPTQPLNVVET